MCHFYNYLGGPKKDLLIFFYVSGQMMVVSSKQASFNNETGYVQVKILINIYIYVYINIFKEIDSFEIIRICTP